MSYRIKNLGKYVEKGAIPWNKSIPCPEETKRKISEGLKGNKCHLGHKHSEETRRKISEACKGRKPWNTGLTKEVSKSLRDMGKQHSQIMKKLFKKGKWIPHYKGKKIPEDVRLKLSRSHKGQHSSRRTEFKKGLIPWIKGKKHSEESKQKMREAIFRIENFKGNRGSAKHQNSVKILTKQLEDGKRKIEIEKSIHFVDGRWRIIDILVDGRICYEVGTCEQSKIDDLTKHGYAVNIIPYSAIDVVA